MTGLEPPPCPISFDDYLKRGIPFTPSCSKGQAELSFGLASIKPAKKIVGRLDLLVRMYHNRLCTYRIKLPRFQESNAVGV